MARTAIFDSIDAPSLKGMMDNDEAFVLLDVLPPEHYALAHIPGAANACVYDVAFAAHVNDITRERTATLVVYGAGEGSLDAVSAAEKLHRMGFHAIVIFHGGIPAWHESGFVLAGSMACPQEPEQAFSLREDAVWRVLPGESSLEWWGRNAVSTHHGTLAVARGGLRVQDGNFDGTIVLDMGTIRNLDLQGTDEQSVLEAHLASDDFFFASLFPSAELHIAHSSQLEPQSPTTPNLLLHATLTLRGLSNALEIPATVTPLPDNRIVLEAHLDVDRTRWGILYGSTRFFKHLAHHMVFDHVSVQARVVAQGR